MPSHETNKKGQGGGCFSIPELDGVAMRGLISLETWAQ